MTISSCVPHRPSVAIKQGSPQEFIISADGVLDVFSVSGPVARCASERNQDRRMETYWEITPLQDFDVSQFSKSTPIIYGKVPAGFRQVTPPNNIPPRPICEGGTHAVQLAIRDRGGVNMLFAVTADGKILTEADAD